MIASTNLPPGQVAFEGLFEYCYIYSSFDQEIHHLMKQLLLITVALLLAASLYADCKSRGLWIFPTGHTIKQNSIFVLDGYFNSQNIILGLNRTNYIYLKSGQKKVRLLVAEICIGQFYLSQAVLKPETTLDAGLEYTLYIDSLPKSETLERYNKTTHKFEPVRYKVIAGNDMEAPRIFGRPKVLAKQYESFGCGPARHIVFSNPAKDQSAIIVKTTVKNLITGEETTYYIKPDGDKINVGHDMCAGAFRFADGNKFEVAFSFMDASGNLTSAGERIKFTGLMRTTPPPLACEVFYESNWKLDIYTQPEKEPEYPGGSAAWSQYIKNNLNEANLDGGIDCNVSIRMIIDTTGAIMWAKPIRAGGIVSFPNANEKEVIRLYLNSGTWLPGQCGGKKVVTEIEQSYTPCIIN